MTERHHNQTIADPGDEPIPTLVVDDAGAWVKSLRAFLEGPPVRVPAPAGNGHDGLAHIRSLRAALVLLDLQMPRMNGFEVASIIRCRFPEVIVVMMNTYADAAGEDEAGAHFSHAVVAKGDAIGAVLPTVFRLFPASARLAAAQSFARVRSAVPAVVLMDVSMPQADFPAATPVVKAGTDAPRVAFVASRSLELSLASVFEQTRGGESAGYCSWKLTWAPPT